jgi:hypothetical protein
MSLLRTGEIKHRGILPKIPMCNGPEISTIKGEDSMCCVFCYDVRHLKYRGDGIVTDSPMVIEFVKKLDFFASNIGRNFFTLTTCGEKPMIAYSPKKSELVVESYIDLLRKIFLLRREMKLVNKKIVFSDFATCEADVPIVLPNDETEKREKFGGDEGVLIEKQILKVTDLDEAFKSGKWMYLINFYQALGVCSKSFRTDTYEIFR